MASRIVLITGKHPPLKTRQSTQAETQTLGANSGVGYATTKVLATASPDFHIIMTGRSLEKVSTAKSEIETSGIKGSLSALQLDITSPTSINTAVNHVEQTHGHLDALINNAAVGSRGPHLLTRMRECFETNVFGCAAVAEAFRPLLLKSPNPYSVFVSSGVGSIGSIAGKTDADKIPFDDAYRASKSALNMIATVEARDYAAKGLKVFPMCPGFVVSNLRGTGEQERTGWGNAGDPAESGRLVLRILSGERDADVGRLVHKDGVYPW